MERATALHPSDVAGTEPPAPWPNRDSEVLYRRPPAVHSLATEQTAQADGWDAFEPAARPSGPEAAWNAFGENPDPDPWERLDAARIPDADAPPPARASFGVTDGPISPSGLLGEHPSGLLGSGDGGHEIRPHRATRHDVTPHPQAGTTEPRRRSRTVVAGVVVLAVVVLLGGAVAGVAFFSDPGGGGGLTSTLSLGGADRTAARTARAPLAGRTAAALDVVAATSKVSVRSGDLGDDLYRITTAGTGTVPTAVLAKDRVALYLVPNGDTAPGPVEVLLSSRVRWSLSFGGGSADQVVDLTGARLAGIDLAGGSRRTTLTLPAATGTVPIRVTGAIEDLSITAPAASPVRITVDSGAQTVVAGARTLRDVAPGSTLTPKNWQTGNRYAVDAAARVTRLSVRTTK